MNWLHNICVAGLGLMLGLGCAHAQADDLPEWLDHASAQEAASEQAPPAKHQQRWFLEGGLYRLIQDTQPTQDYRGNLGLDAYLTQSFGTRWSAQLSGRIDLDQASGLGLNHNNLSIGLRELYVSAQIGDVTLDLGRINILDGVSPGFNPSDVFRVGALTARRTENPTRLRESRLGVVGLRAQTALLGGSLAAMLVPELGISQTPRWYDPQWGAVNGGQSQAYLMYTLPRWQDVYANILAHRQRDGNSSLGFNVSKSLGQQWLASLEMASTKRSRFASLAQEGPAAVERYAQAAMAVSYSTPTRQTLTLEYDYNGGGLTRNEFAGGWQSASIAGTWRAIAEAGRRQEPLNAHALMLMLQWDRFLIRNSQLDLLVRYNAIDHSKLMWSQWRYQLPKLELGLGVSRMSGTPRSQYGAPNSRWTLGVRVRHFF